MFCSIWAFRRVYLQADDLNAVVEEKSISRYDLDRETNSSMWKTLVRATLDFKYRLKARFPLRPERRPIRFTTTIPEQQTHVQPTLVTVQARPRRHNDNKAGCRLQAGLVIPFSLCLERILECTHQLRLGWQNSHKIRRFMSRVAHKCVYMHKETVCSAHRGSMSRAHASIPRANFLTCRKPACRRRLTLRARTPVCVNDDLSAYQAHGCAPADARGISRAWESGTISHSCGSRHIQDHQSLHCYFNLAASSCGVISILAHVLFRPHATERS